MLKRFTEFAARLQGSVFALPVALGVAVLMVAISELAFGQARKELQTLTVLGQARLEVTHILRRVTDAETGQRGYLLTGSADYLAPFRDANREAAEGLERLNQQLKDAGESRLQTARQALQTTVEQRMSEMNVVLSLYESKRQRGAVEMVGSGIGREHMEQTRQHADALLNALNERIGQGLVRIFDTLLLGRVGVTLLSAVSLLAVLMFLQLGRQLARQREEQRASIALERDRLTHEVQQRTTELTELARHLVNVREDERARLARDLHDELGALLTTAKLDVARLRPRLSGESPEVSARLAHLIEALNSGIALKRRIIEDLRPSTLDNLGLQVALENLCSESAELLGIPVHAELQAVRLAPSAQLTVFRCVQEGLTNIGKYARASEVRVRLWQAAGGGKDGDGGGGAMLTVFVEIIDNGQGFEPQQLGLARHGLLGMRYRVEAERGRMRIDSAAGRGCRLHIELPAQADELATDTSPDTKREA